MAALKNLLDRKRGQIVHLRLSTRPISQALFPQERLRDETGAKTLQESVLRGGYCIVNYQNDPSYRPGVNVIYIFACGVMVPNAIEASQVLRQGNIFANVIEVTSPDLLH